MGRAKKRRGEKVKINEGKRSLRKFNKTREGDRKRVKK